MGTVKMKKILWCKELTRYWSNNPYDEVCDSLILDIIKHVLDEKPLQSSKSYIFVRSMEDPGNIICYKWKWHKVENFVTVCWWINRKSTTGLRVTEQDSRRKIELGESHSNVDDVHKDY